MLSKLKKIFSSKRPSPTPTKQAMPLDLSNYNHTGIVHEIAAPKLTDSDEKYKITQWNVQPGGIIKEGGILCTIETGKVAIEYESTINGKILWCHTLDVEFTENTIICKIEEL